MSSFSDLYDVNVIAAILSKIHPSNEKTVMAIRAVNKVFLSQSRPAFGMQCYISKDDKYYCTDIIKDEKSCIKLIVNNENQVREAERLLKEGKNY